MSDPRPGRPGRRAAPTREAPRSTAGAEPLDVLELFTRTAEGVMAVAPSCRVILWNAAAEAILGYTAEEVLGRACHELIDGRDPAGNLFCHPHCAVLTMARRDQPAHAYDITTQAKDGSGRRLNVSTVFVPGAEGSIVVHLFRDVTAARRAQLAEPAAADGDAGTPPEASGGWAGQLTAREREILRLMAYGEDTRAMARRLFISPATVRNHTQSILTKLGVHSRLEAVALAFRERVL